MCVSKTGYCKSSNTSRASNTGWGSKHVVLIEAGPRIEAGFRGVHTNNLNTSIATDLGMSVDDLGCTEEDEENELFVDDDDDNVDDYDFEK